MDVIGGGAAVSQVTLSGIASSGYLSVASANNVSTIIRAVIVVPVTSTNQYKLSLKEQSNNYHLIRSGVTFTGTQVFVTPLPLYNDVYEIEIFSATVDEQFNFFVRFG